MSMLHRNENSPSFVLVRMYICMYLCMYIHILYIYIYIYMTRNVYICFTIDVDLHFETKVTK